MARRRRHPRRKEHIMFAKVVPLSLLLGLLTFCSPPAHAGGGPFYNTLYNTFCSGLPYHERLGCHGYLQYRIQRGKSRDEALNKCLWGCGELYDDPAQVENCRKGCQEANTKDN
jgi:hypothetical protein